MTATQFLKQLEEPRHSALSHLRKMIRVNVPKAVEKVTTMMGKEMIVYEYPAGTFFAAIASGKNYMSLHLMPLYCFPELVARNKSRLKGVKMGKACLNFKALEELPLDVIEEILRESASGSWEALLRSLKKK